jgi:hypothetical protein
VRLLEGGQVLGALRRQLPLPLRLLPAPARAAACSLATNAQTVGPQTWRKVGNAGWQAARHPAEQASMLMSSPAEGLNLVGGRGLQPARQVRLALGLPGSQRALQLGEAALLRRRGGRGEARRPFVGSCGTCRLVSACWCAVGAAKTTSCVPPRPSPPLKPVILQRRWPPTCATTSSCSRSSHSCCS